MVSSCSALASLHHPSPQAAGGVDFVYRMGFASGFRGDISETRQRVPWGATAVGTNVYK